MFLTGDIHSSWAMDVPVERSAQYRSAGVEFVCPSVTSDGFYELNTAASHGAPVPAVDAALADEDRHLPEPAQLRWLKRGLARRGRTWHLVGNQVIFTPVRFPGAALGFPAGQYLNSDQWDGYQADQAALV